MPFHLAGWSASVDQAAIAAIAAVADPSLTVSGNNVQIPDFGNYLMGMYGVGVNITRMQLQSPSLRRVLNPECRGLDYSATPNNNPAFQNLMDSPIQLDVAEQMQALTSEDGAGATRMSAFAWIGDGKAAPVNNPTFSVRATGATTLVVYTWTNVPLVFDQALPVGDYAIVGARGESAGLLVFRFVFQGSTPRPGGIGQVSQKTIDAVGQRFGGWGVWGMFNSTTPPTVDCFSGSADTSEIFTLDLVKAS
jgi:hypothetical protein